LRSSARTDFLTIERPAPAERSAPLERPAPLSAPR
jgi:hypothetical protein